MRAERRGAARAQAARGAHQGDRQERHERRQHVGDHVPGDRRHIAHQRQHERAVARLRAARGRQPRHAHRAQESLHARVRGRGPPPRPGHGRGSRSGGARRALLELLCARARSRFRRPPGMAPGALCARGVLSVLEHAESVHRCTMCRLRQCPPLEPQAGLWAGLAHSGVGSRRGGHVMQPGGAAEAWQDTAALNALPGKAGAGSLSACGARGAGARGRALAASRPRCAAPLRGRRGSCEPGW